MKKNYEVWPLGKLPKELQRPEIDQLKAAGYEIDDPREAVTIFENKMAELAGAKYAVAVDNCTDAVFLSLLWQKELGTDVKTVTMPARTYISIPIIAKNAGFNVEFENVDWSGKYELKPFKIYDAATMLTEGMYEPGSYHCISFQIKKRLPIGKGGMILTDSKEAEEWFRLASFEGRDLSIPQWECNPTVLGWNMYMTPEDAARGILILDKLPRVNEDTSTQDNYPDLSKLEIFQ